MLRKLQQLREEEEGFTIIEVLIVLAIAALILVIVLIAIPQLQRNQRNTARQSDASRVLTAVQNWSANNNGKVFVRGTTDNANLSAVINDVGANVGQYQLNTGGNADGATGATAAAGCLDNGTPRATICVKTGAVNGGMTDLNDLIIVTGAKCSDNGATVTGASRDVVVQYTQEGSSSNNGRCVGGS